MWGLDMDIDVKTTPGFCPPDNFDSSELFRLVWWLGYIEVVVGCEEEDYFAQFDELGLIGIAGPRVGGGARRRTMRDER
ncbi:hypothetical protein ACE6H2_025908 [Prunus campanulata]